MTPSPTARALVVGLTLFGLAACGGPVVDAVPAAPSYDGPLFVEVTASPDDEDADRSGAAGRVVDCDFAHRGWSEPSPFPGEVSRSPESALKKEVTELPRGPTSGFVEVRRETDRVLYTYEVEQRTRLAYVVRQGPTLDGHDGWYVESWASCDWAELPAAWSDERGIQLWSDGGGRRQPTSVVVSGAGPAHCDWEDMTFLNLGGGDLKDGQTYVSHPDPVHYPDHFTVPYDEGRPLPADAVDTGWSREGRHLWLAADRSRAFVGTQSSVDVWPATVQPFGCA